MSRDWTGVEGIDPYFSRTCSICGRPPHPCDDPECVPATAPIAEKLRVAMRTVSELQEEITRLRQITIERSSESVKYKDAADEVSYLYDEAKVSLAFEKDQREADGQGREVVKLLLRKEVAQECLSIVQTTKKWSDVVRAIREKFGIEI